MRCDICPRVGPCSGEDVPRLCRLVDPAHPDHDPAYLAILAPPPPEPTSGRLAALAPFIRAARDCPHRGPAEGACGCSWCGRDARKVTPPECWECRRAAGG